MLQDSNFDETENKIEDKTEDLIEKNIFYNIENETEEFSFKNLKIFAYALPFLGVEISQVKDEISSKNKKNTKALEKLELPIIAKCIKSGMDKYKETVPTVPTEIPGMFDAETIKCIIYIIQKYGSMHDKGMRDKRKL